MLEKNAAQTGVPIYCANSAIGLISVILQTNTKLR